MNEVKEEESFFSYVNKDGVYKGPEAWSGDVVSVLDPLETFGEKSKKNTNLVSLGTLKAISGDMHLNNEENLEDLGNLEVVGRYVSITASKKLKTLGKLKEIGGGATFVGNKALESIGALTHVGGQCMITGNNIKELTGLEFVLLDMTLDAYTLPTYTLKNTNILVSNPEKGLGLDTCSYEYLRTLDEIKKADTTELLTMRANLHAVYSETIDKRLQGV